MSQLYVATSTWAVWEPHDSDGERVIVPVIGWLWDGGGSPPWTGRGRALVLDPGTNELIDACGGPQPERHYGARITTEDPNV